MMKSTTLWATIGSWFQQGFGVLTLLVVARYVDPAAFGVIATVMLLVLLAQRVLLEAISYCVVRAEADSSEIRDALFWIGLLFSVLFAAGLFYGADLAADWFGDTRMADALRALSLIPVLDALGAVQVGVLRREMRFRDLAMRTLWAGLLSSIVGIVLAVAGAGIWSLVAQQLILSLGGTWALWRSVPWRPGWSQGWTHVRAGLRFGLPMTGNAVLFVLANRVDILFLSAAAGVSASGIYSLAKRLARLASDLLVNGAAGVALSEFSRLQGDASALAAAIERRMSYIALLSFPVFALLAAASDDLIACTLGAQWQGAGPVVTILCGYGAMQAIQVVAGHVLVARGKSIWLTGVNGAALALLCAMMLAGLANGVVGVAWAFVGQLSLSLPLLLMLSVRAGGPSLRVWVRALAAPLGLALLGGGAVWLVIMGLASTTPLARLTLSGAVWLCITLIGIRLLAPAAFVGIGQRLGRLRQ